MRFHKIFLSAYYVCSIIPDCEDSNNKNSNNNTDDDHYLDISLKLEHLKLPSVDFINVSYFFSIVVLICDSTLPRDRWQSLQT